MGTVQSGNAVDGDSTNVKRRRGAIRLVGTIALRALLAAAVVGVVVWGALFIYHSNLSVPFARAALAGAFVGGAVLAFVVYRRRPRRALAVVGAAFALLLGWFFLIPASNDRDWRPEVAVLADATVDGDLVTVRNVRNLDYRTETDFAPRYYDKTFDLRKLESVDLLCVYWGSDKIAHVIVSFGFGGDDFVCFSIETRLERGEEGSGLRGLFRHYEVVCVVADERDVVRVRTNYRTPREQVYLYRTRLPRENQRALFMSYVRTVNELAQRPRWYNTLADNCTTGVLLQTRAYQRRARYNWKILLSGYVPQYAYEIGMLDNSMPFDELRRTSLINAKAEAAGGAADFSRQIRAGLPLPQAMSMEQYLRR